jgi:gas vesicle protein
MNGKTCTSGALLLLAGGLIGAGLAILYAPRSGPKTRRKLLRYAEKVQGDAEELFRDTTSSLSEVMEELSERSADLIERGSEVTQEWRQQLLSTMESGQKSLETQRRKLTKLWG